ncbi:aminotransferase class V-fold PLP-dependent enzyme [Lentzea sp. NPDC051213]|uniref:aminotransferase class V-fold PLP-dependent enzyme n=1 Tax=Lentzea sp. NPDC051213 TaxID=3364126 RepID=UPI003797E14F
MLRDEFPLLGTCVYLNSNSTGAQPRGVRQVLDDYWATITSWRDSAWGGWLEAMAGYRDALADFLGAPRGTVVTDVNTSTLLGRVGTCLDFTGRNRVVLSHLEFPSMPFLWRGFARYGAEVVVAGGPGPAFDEDALVAAIDEQTRIVCVSHGSYTTGALIDVTRIVARAKEVGALVLLDAFQTVGVVPVDLAASGVDFAVGGAHKWLCGAHTAFLYARQDLLPELRPAATGWFASESPLSWAPPTQWAPDAQRLASGMPVPLTAMMSRVGLDLFASVGVAQIRAHSLRCTDRIIERADEAGIAVVTPREETRRGGVVVLSFPGDQAVHTRLDAAGMVCSYRGGLRIAPHVYNTLDEVDRFMDEVVA